ncbi:MAG: sulfatase-like hydrolase/transferase, partial [Nitrososphaera sp.]
MPAKIFATLFCSFAVASLLVPYGNPALFPGGLNDAYGLAFRPNIVVIMADDLDQRSLDILLQEGLMPKLKQHVIDKAVTFSESFATYPLCCPSRATFLTGQYPHNHNVWSNSLPLGGVTKLNDSSTLATWLQESGYYTAYVGKYLNRYGLDTDQTYIPPGWNDWQATVGSSTYWMYSYTVNDNGALVKHGTAAGDYQTDVLGERSVQVINERESSDSTPFFLYINPLAPHEDGKTPLCELNYGDIKSTRPAPRHIGT